MTAHNIIHMSPMNTARRRSAGIDHLYVLRAAAQWPHRNGISEARILTIKPLSLAIPLVAGTVIQLAVTAQALSHTENWPNS